MYRNFYHILPPEKTTCLNITLLWFQQLCLSNITLNMRYWCSLARNNAEKRESVPWYRHFCSGTWWISPDTKSSTLGNWAGILHTYSGHLKEVNHTIKTQTHITDRTQWINYSIVRHNHFPHLFIWYRCIADFVFLSVSILFLPKDG